MGILHVEWQAGALDDMSTTGGCDGTDQVAAGEDD